jgi:hypothetical protein
MATKKEQPQEGKGKAETKSQLLKKMVFAFKAKREGGLSAEDFKAMNVQLRSSPVVRRPITLFDTDPYDSIITADRDETDMIHMYDTDVTDRLGSI